MTEAINAFFVLIMVLGLLTGIVTLIALLIMAIRKDKLKTPLWITGSAFFVAFIGFFGVLVIAIATTFNEPIATTESEYSAVEANEPENEDEIEVDLATEEIEEDSHLTKDGRDPTDDSEYRTDVNIRDIERNPDDYENEWIAFEGRIVQVMEDDVTTAYRIAVNDDIDRMVYLETLTDTLDERLLKDDHVEVYGSFYDLVTYETVMGGTRTIPAFNAHGERIALQETSE